MFVQNEGQNFAGANLPRLRRRSISASLHPSTKPRIPGIRCSSSLVHGHAATIRSSVPSDTIGPLSTRRPFVRLATSLLKARSLFRKISVRRVRGSARDIIRSAGGVLDRFRLRRDSESDTRPPFTGVVELLPFPSPIAERISLTRGGVSAPDPSGLPPWSLSTRTVCDSPAASSSESRFVSANVNDKPVCSCAGRRSGLPKAELSSDKSCASPFGCCRGHLGLGLCSSSFDARLLGLALVADAVAAPWPSGAATEVLGGGS